MRSSTAQAKIEYGDFQTPLALATRICRKLADLGIAPQVIIEPTCGRGAFVMAAFEAFTQQPQILGFEINPQYLTELRCELASRDKLPRVSLQQADFFAFDWQSLFATLKEEVLLLGNLPWVTNAVQGLLSSRNLPEKSNFQGQKGLDALTGKSNFDISEWMLMRLLEPLRQRAGYAAFVCKVSVARKILSWMRNTHFAVQRAAIYRIDAARYFGVSVETCLLYLHFGGASKLNSYEVFADLDSETGVSSGWHEQVMVRDLSAFDACRAYFGNSSHRWRSGIKHDCAEILELKLVKGALVNGLGQTVEIEPQLLFPLLKGSDVANGRIQSADRYLLVPQKATGEDTRGLKHYLPLTWAYLESHAELFEQRKSRIYRDNPRFSIFGVGDYTFASWKIAICGLYKKLEFQLVGPMHGKPVVFDDTVYFLGFNSKSEAEEVLAALRAENAQRLLDSLIFWDEKRPIKAAVLNHLKLDKLQNIPATLFAL
jgi:hypothetical protein